MRSTFLPVVLLAVCASAWACDASLDGTGALENTVDGGAGGASDAGLPPGLSADDALAVCTAYRTSICNFQDRCPGKDELYSFASKDDCIRLGIEACVVSMQLPGTAITVADAQSCAQKRDAAECGQEPNCDIAGKLVVGQPCYGDQQCASSYCDANPAGSCGVCANAPAPDRPTTAPATCTANEQCPERLRCQQGTCSALANPRGQPCDDAAGDCPTGFVCANINAGDPAFCYEERDTAAVGAACERSALDSAAFTVDECAQGYCGGPAEGPTTCLPITTEGAACGTLSVGPICPVGFTCDTTSRTCTLIPFDGCR
jgi:hypothetical protein